jgi:hypothetical protein
MTTMTCSTRLTGLTGLAIAALLLACVAKDSDTLGELDDASTSASTGATDHGSDTDAPADDDGATSAASDGADGADAADDAATTAMTGGTDDGDPPPPLSCEPGLTPAEPSSCPQGLGLELPEPGCFEECTGEGDACSVGTCQLVEYNPCPCPEGAEKCCGACTGEIWLCVEEVTDAFCDAIVGTTFESIEELECGLGPKGVELCHWQLRFEENGEWLWNYSDVGQGGDYTCVGGVLTITNDVTIEHAYDPKTHILTLEGVDYQPAAP